MLTDDQPLPAGQDPPRAPSWAGVIPADVFSEILQKLTPQEQGAVRLTCKAWRALTFHGLKRLTVHVPADPSRPLPLPLPCLPQSREVSPAAPKIPAPVPAALQLLPAFMALTQLRLDLPPHSVCAPVAAGLPPCLEELIVVCGTTPKVFSFFCFLCLVVWDALLQVVVYYELRSSEAAPGLPPQSACAPVAAELPTYLEKLVVICGATPKVCCAPISCFFMSGCRSLISIKRRYFGPPCLLKSNV
jgi:hypothetical protein